MALHRSAGGGEVGKQPVQGAWAEHVLQRRSKVSLCHCRVGNEPGSTPVTGSARPSAVSSTGSTPTSGSAAGYALPGAQHVLVHAGRFAAYVLKHENVLLAEATPGGLPGVGHQPVLPLWAAQL